MTRSEAIETIRNWAAEVHATGGENRPDPTPSGVDGERLAEAARVLTLPVAAEVYRAALEALEGPP